MKAGILEEMIEDTMEGLEGEGEEEEEAAQAEIDRIMFELTAGALGTAPDALKGQFYITIEPELNCNDMGTSILYFFAVFRIRIHRIHMFLGHKDPDPLVRGMDPDPDPPIITQK